MVAEAGSQRQYLVGVLVVCMVAATAGADIDSFQSYNKTRDMFGRMSRSATWDRGSPPVDRHLSFFPVDPADEITKDTREGRDITEFRSLCGVTRVRKEFKEKGYEFRPPYYDEVTCKHRPIDFTPVPTNKCDYPFMCVQRRRELFVTRRSFSESCWETVSVQVPSGCECMWPDSRFGEFE